MNSFRSFSRTFFCMKPRSGTEAFAAVLDADLVGDQRLDAVVVGFLQHRAHHNAVRNIANAMMTEFGRRGRGAQGGAQRDSTTTIR